MTDLQPAVSTVVRQCLGVRAGEEVVVVVDRATRTIGEALRDEAAAAGADAVTNHAKASLLPATLVSL